MSETEAPTKLDQIVSHYIKLRDRKAERKKEYEAEVEAIDQAMTKIENFLLKHLQENGSESVRTAAGTFFKKVATRASVADWDAVLDFIVENEAWSMLERRVSKSAVEQYRQEHDDLPPGINWTEALLVEVRRS